MALLISMASTPYCTAANEITESDNWYQVELIIFKRNNNVSDYDKEVWPKNLALAYPPNVQPLFDPAEQDETQPLETSESVNNQNAVNTTERLANTEITPTDSLTEKTSSDDAERPFSLLNAEQYFIKGANYALKREPGVTILFHESWRQPMVELEKAPALIIKGGEQFGDHNELEGTVTFSLSRYLHINTDLWLSKFESNYGQEDKHWPELPTLPTSKISFLDEPSSLASNGFQGDNIGFDTIQQDSFGIQLDGTQTGLDLSKSTDLFLNNFTRLTEKPYLIKEIVTLRQKRRMRSDELHYIDHPRMGILVKIMPYTSLQNADVQEIKNDSL